VNEVVTRGIYSQKKRPRYAYIAPQRNQAEKIAWEYLKEYTRGLEAKKPSETDLSVTLKHNGAELCIYGADNPDSFRGQYFDGVILDEYGDMPPSVWGKVLLPTLADRKGWAVFIGTPKGKNHFYKIFTEAGGKEDTWFRFILKASESGILPAEELELMRAEMDEDEYQQEFECSFDAAVKGTYYASILAKYDNQVSASVAYDPEHPVDVWCDLGYTDSSAYWFAQSRPDGLAIIDYEEAHSQPLSYYFGMLREKGYKYGTIWLPHDATAKTLSTERSTVEQFRDAELPRFDSDQAYLIRISPRLSLQSGVDAVRKILPMCWFNPRCSQGIEGLRAYRRRWDETTKSFSDSPTHDWSSHPSDAFRYLCLTARERILPRTEEPKSRSSSPIFTLDELFEDRESRILNLDGRI
jgi:phage terminase large subunit